MVEVKLIPIQIGELKSLIHFAYEGDADLIDKYQAGDRTFEECVDFNFAEIEHYFNTNVFKDDMKLWKITLQADDEMEDAGYCVTIENDGMPNVLYSFAINIQYRKKQYLIQWLREVERVLDVPFYTGLWNKNTRAIDFFKKNGFEERKSAKSEDVKLLVKGSNLVPKNVNIWQ